MVKVFFGDILKSKAQTLVNTVNCVGIMGKGIALKFKEQFWTKYLKENSDLQNFIEKKG